MNDERQDHIDPERPPKGTLCCNYRPMMCVLLMWKLLKHRLEKHIGSMLRTVSPKNRIMPKGNKRNK